MAIKKIRFNNCNAHTYRNGWNDVFVSYDTTVARFDRKTEVLHLYPLNVGYSSTTSKQVTQWLYQYIGWNIGSRERNMFEKWAEKGIIKHGEVFEWRFGKFCLDYSCGIGNKDRWLNDAIAMGCDIL